MTNEELVIQIQSGIDITENMTKLWIQNKGIIYQIAKKYIGYEEIDDLLQIGYEGLYKAVEHYKPATEVPFIHYATFWIKATMQRHIENCSCVIRMPTYARAEVQQYRRFISDYQKEYGCSPSDSEIQSFLYVSGEKLETIKNNVNLVNIQSLDRPLDTDDTETTLCDMIADTSNNEDDLIKSLDTEIMTRELWAAVEELPGDMSEVIKSRFRKRKTLKEIGEDQGVTLGYVRQIQRKALRKLRTSHNCRGCEEYYLEYIANPVFRLGVNQFNRTWTSAVELEALKRLEEWENIVHE